MGNLSLTRVINSRNEKQKDVYQNPFADGESRVALPLCSELGKLPNRLGGLCLRVVELFDLEAFGNNNGCSVNSKCLLLNVIIYQYIEANPFFASLTDRVTKLR